MSARQAKSSPFPPQPFQPLFESPPLFFVSISNDKLTSAGARWPKKKKMTMLMMVKPTMPRVLCITLIALYPPYPFLFYNITQYLRHAQQ